MSDTAMQMYSLAVKRKCRTYSSGLWSPWYVRGLWRDTDMLRQLFDALPEPRIPRVDEAIARVLDALEQDLLRWPYHKKRITYLFFALHNLPRAYLPASERMHITQDDALSYSAQWFDMADLPLVE